MDANNIRESLNRTGSSGFDLYERRPGDYQLILPIIHEDGDMLDVYLQESPLGEEYIRICDFGLALMRLSYAYNLDTPARQRILDSILINNRVKNDHTNIYLDTHVSALYEGVLQFAGCIQKVCNMRYWSRETVRTAFYDDLAEYVTVGLSRFSPVADRSPLTDYPIISVDWTLTHNERSLFVFGVRGDNKAKSVAISLLEFQKARLSYISLIVHENMEELGTKESVYLTKNADRQYPILEDFREKAVDDIERIVGGSNLRESYTI